MPTEYSESGLWAVGENWYLTAHGDDPVVKVLSATPETDLEGAPTGSFTVTYLAGMNVRDGAEYSPIRRYVRAHAMNSPEVTRLWRDVVKPTKTIKSSSTQGQSVSYDVPTLGGGGAAGSGVPGALPKIGTLDRWRLAGRRVHQGETHFGERYYTAERY